MFCAIMALFVSDHLPIFLFFKQKTAYEMRISDWISDVCSSDLKIHDPMVDPLKNVRGLASAKEGVQHWWVQRVTAIALVPLALVMQIGRASCRERVCQYV